MSRAKKPGDSPLTDLTNKASELAELERWIGREMVHDGVDDVSRSDIRRTLETYCFDGPLYTEDDVARVHGYRMACAPWSLTPLWALEAYGSRGDPPLFGPGRKERSVIGAVRS